MARVANHGRQLEQVAIAKEAIRRVEEQTHQTMNVRELLDERCSSWLEEWPGSATQCQLVLDYSAIPSDLEVDCGALTLGTTFTCLLRNAVEAASFRLREGSRTERLVHVTIVAADLDNAEDYVQVLVRDDAGGIDKAMVPFLFVKGKSGVAGGKGTGLALARAGLLMNQADLQFLEDNNDSATVFRILMRRGEPHVPADTSDDRGTRRRQQARSS